MSAFLRALAGILAGLLITHIPALAPYKDDLLTILVVGLSGLAAWGAGRLAHLHAEKEETSANTKSVQAALNDALGEPVVKEDGKLGAVTADALKNVIAVASKETRK